MKTSTVASGPDVLILGAGAAGLAAAADITAGGMSVGILEARDRIGGRLHTASHPKFPVRLDLGAEFIHGFPKESWGLVTRCGLPVYEIPDRHHGVDRRNQIREAPDFWDRIESVFKKLRREGRDRSFQDFLDHTGGWSGPEDRKLARLFVEGFHAADPNVISEHALASEEVGSRAIDGTLVSRIDGGMSLFAEALFSLIREKLCDLHLGCRAESIRWGRGLVEVVGRDSSGGEVQWRGRRLLVTVPPRLFLTLAFQPTLFRKREAFSLIRSGAVSKVLFSFKEAFWENKFRSLAFLHTEERYFPTWWTTQPFHYPVLTAWSGGPAALELSGMPAEKRERLALVTLGKIFRMSFSDLRHLVVGVQGVDWASDPLAQGAYSYLVTGAMGAPAEAAAPIEDTLYFAGEATESRGISGTVEAALVSGRRAAAELLRAATRVGSLREKAG